MPRLNRHHDNDDDRRPHLFRNPIQHPAISPPPPPPHLFRNPIQHPAISPPPPPQWRRPIQHPAISRDYDDDGDKNSRGHPREVGGSDPIDTITGLLQKAHLSAEGDDDSKGVKIYLNVHMDHNHIENLAFSRKEPRRKSRPKCSCRTDSCCC